MVLPASEGELGLQEQILSGHGATLDCRRDGATHRCLVVMAALVGRVDAPKPLTQGQLAEALRAVFLPSGPIEEAGHAEAFDGQGLVGHLTSPAIASLAIRCEEQSSPNRFSLLHVYWWNNFPTCGFGGILPPVHAGSIKESAFVQGVLWYVTRSDIVIG